MRRTAAALLFLLVPLALPATAQSDVLRSFGAETPVDRSVKVPQSVLRTLRRDERVRQCLADPQEQKRGLASWFAASAVDLNDDGRPDLVVKPKNLCLFGANIVPFWVFRNAGKRYELALKTYALGLNILRAKSHGYRDVETGAASAVKAFGAVYSFDGKSYQPKKCWDESQDEAGRSKVNFYKCGDAEKPY